MTDNVCVVNTIDIRKSIPKFEKRPVVAQIVPIGHLGWLVNKANFKSIETKFMNETCVDSLICKTNLI